MAIIRKSVQGKNPANEKHELFKKLTRIFSGPIVNYKAQVEKSLRKRQLNKYNLNIRTTDGRHFKKQSFNFYDSLQSNLFVNHQRHQRYNDFAEMDTDAFVSSCLDVYSDEMTTYSKLQPILTINCPNEEIKEILKVLYFDILNIECNLSGWCRALCKMGDFFLYLDIDETQGVKRGIGLPPGDVERMEGQDKTNPDYVQFQINAGGITLENWQVAHFRILDNDKYAPYGRSVLDGARRTWRQLVLVEDAMMAYRIVRSPERKVFYVDIGNIPPQDVEPFMQRFISNMKRNQIVDATTGKVDLRYNPLSIEDDYFIPVRGAATSMKIETLPGGHYVGDIDDVKYLRDKLFAALKVPMSYLSRGEGADEDKSTLAAKDIRFARTIQRLQKSLIAELTKVGLVHLYVLGYRNEDLLSFDLALNNPSKIAELQELEYWRTKFDVANAATEGLFDRRWIAEKLFNISEEEFLRCQRGMYYDKWMDAQLEAVSSASKEGGLEGGALGDELGGGEEELETPEEKPEDESILLAKPEEGGIGKRNEPYLTPKAKGKLYYPVSTDKRDMGARKRSYLSTGFSREMASNTTRNLFKGYEPLKSLSKGISESTETTNYSKEVLIEEKTILKNNFEIKELLERLEKRNDKKE